MYLENNTFKAQKFGRSRIAQQTLLVCNVNMAATRDTGRLNRGNTSSLMSDYPRYKALWFFKNVLGMHCTERIFDRLTGNIHVGCRCGRERLRQSR